jgi:hypothetical protein
VDRYSLDDVIVAAEALRYVRVLERHERKPSEGTGDEDVLDHAVRGEVLSQVAVGQFFRAAPHENFARMV